MSDPQQSLTEADARQLYGFVLTDEGPILYFDLLMWKRALEEESASPFCDRPFGYVRDGVRISEPLAA